MPRDQLGRTWAKQRKSQNVFPMDRRFASARFNTSAKEILLRRFQRVPGFRERGMGLKELLVDRRVERPDKSEKVHFSFKRKTV